MIVVNDWVSVLGKGNNTCDGIIQVNEYISYKFGDMFIVATDIVGGLYAINQGKYANGLGKIWYFAPDTLEWENLHMEYSEYIAWLAIGIE